MQKGSNFQLCTRRYLIYYVPRDYTVLFVKTTTIYLQQMNTSNNAVSVWKILKIFYFGSVEFARKGIVLTDNVAVF
jgi:hypothetical protein